ncbi:MAG: carbon-phosphorus lyase complex subunit PhnI [Micrococcales bacterium]|nr:carbon-phosphorus lyase complex subunit PhnI [Micrococcales bacterium]MCL2667914.1 carbon-phosphorus lyase complex subunit PhnI [Micrococcales bacterium]
MYVAVKGGEQAIANAHALLAQRGRGTGPRLGADQVRDQLGVLVSRVMSEGSLYDEDLAARAVVQAQGDVLEAVTLVRTYRTTLPRFGTTAAVDTARLPSERRVSATFKDIPGGQQLGATFDYTHRLLAEPDQGHVDADFDEAEPMARVTDLLGASALIEPASSDESDPDPADLTRDPTVFPMSRAERMQALARGDEGFLLSMGYSTLRGYGGSHPFVGEVRVGQVEVELDVPELGFAVCIGRIEVTECQMVAQFVGSSSVPPMFTRGYGLAFGRSERKAMSMSLVDRALRAEELGERAVAPANDEEFVVEHADNVQASGFVEHLKLPHYVDFQAELALLRTMHDESPQPESPQPQETR